MSKFNWAKWLSIWAAILVIIIFGHLLKKDLSFGEICIMVFLLSHDWGSN